MVKLFCFAATLFLLSCKTTTYYVVRHAEKETATMSSDVPLSEEGKQRAMQLKYSLQGAGVKHIFSTNYSRTLSTVEPTREQLGLTIQLYGANDTLGRFIEMLKKINDGNVLIVGHSNTVDDIVNGLMGKTEIAGDLPDTEYGDLFIVKKTGSRYSYEKKHFGK